MAAVGYRGVVGSQWAEARDSNSASEPLVPQNIWTLRSSHAIDMSNLFSFDIWASPPEKKMARVLLSLFCCFALCIITPDTSATAPAPKVRALQATTISAYLRGGTHVDTANTNNNAAAAVNENAQDDAKYFGEVSSALADTPAVQSGSGATITGAQIGSIAATGALAYDSIGG